MKCSLVKVCIYLILSVSDWKIEVVTWIDQVEIGLSTCLNKKVCFAREAVSQAVQKRKV